MARFSRGSSRRARPAYASRSARSQRSACRRSAAALRLVPGLQVDVLDAGCCGMAGSFGFEKEHYNLSVQIANLQLLPALVARPEALVAAPGTSCRHQIRDLAARPSPARSPRGTARAVTDTGE